MAQRSMFFDATSGDRSYAAADLAALFSAVAQRDGVIYNYNNALSVAQNGAGAMSVLVNTGAAFVLGRMFEVYSAAETLAIAAADATYPRIDRVVVKLDLSSSVRSVALAVKTGTPAASPTAPALQRDTTIWELSLAQVYVGAGVTSILTANITDERGDETLCGYVPRTPDIMHRGTKNDKTAVSTILDDLLSKIVAHEATKVAEINISSAVTSVSFTGLDGNAHGGYTLISEIYNPLASTTGYYMGINGDLDAANYEVQMLVVQNTTTSAYYKTSELPYVTGLNPGKRGSGINNIILTPEGYVRILSHANRSDLGMTIEVAGKLASVSNITQIDVQVLIANGIGVGSRFRLFRRL